MSFDGSTSVAEAQQILNTALDAGINFIDTSNKYNPGESERVLGCWFQSKGGRKNFILDDADHPLFDALMHPVNGVSNFHDSSLWMKACYYNWDLS
jgi:hypothetical protein